MGFIDQVEPDRAMAGSAGVGKPEVHPEPAVVDSKRAYQFHRLALLSMRVALMMPSLLVWKVGEEIVSSRDGPRINANPAKVNASAPKIITRFRVVINAWAF